VIQVFGREGALETGHAHPEGHRVHVNEIGVRLRLPQLLFVGVRVRVNWDVDGNLLPTSRFDVFGEGAETEVVGNVSIVDIEAVGDGVVKDILCLVSPHPQKGYIGYRQSHPRFLLQHMILIL
jgi:hypothetical protein